MRKPSKRLKKIAIKQSNLEKKHTIRYLSICFKITTLVLKYHRSGITSTYPKHDQVAIAHLVQPLLIEIIHFKYLNGCMWFLLSKTMDRLQYTFSIKQIHIIKEQRYEN